MGKFQTKITLKSFAYFDSPFMAHLASAAEQSTPEARVEFVIKMEPAHPRLEFDGIRLDSAHGARFVNCIREGKRRYKVNFVREVPN